MRHFTDIEATSTFEKNSKVPSTSWVGTDAGSSSPEKLNVIIGNRHTGPF
jgi:hypothetical protein